MDERRKEIMWKTETRMHGTKKTEEKRKEEKEKIKRKRNNFFIFYIFLNFL